MIDKTTKNQIKSLAVRGFQRDEIAKLLKIKESAIPKDLLSEDIIENSETLYGELQKDLSKLVMTEMNKDGRDTNVILNAIKLQSELQEKRISLKRAGVGPPSIAKNYIYERDKEMAKMVSEGTKESEVAKQFNVSTLSVKQAVDRVSLNLPEEMMGLSPTIITETKGLDKKTRLNILDEAMRNKLTRDDVRKMVVSIKNKVR